MAEKRFKGVIDIEGKLGNSVRDSFGVLSKITQKLAKDMERLNATGRSINKTFENVSSIGAATDRLERFNRTIQNTKRALDGVRMAQAGLTKMGTGFSKLGFGNGYLAVAATAGLGASIKHMLDVQAEQEQALISLQVMDRSKDKAKQDLSWIDQFAYTSPYQISEVRDAFVRLKSRGLDPEKDDLLKTIGDAASASGRSMADAVQAFDDAMVNRNQMIAGFGIKVIEQGVGQGKALVEFTNHSGQLMKVLIDKTDMAMKQRLYLAIWKDRYGGLMAEQMHSWLGMLSNLKDYWQRFGMAVMQSGPFDKMKAQLSDVLDRLGQAVKDGSFQRTAAQWGERISELVDEMIFLGKAAIWVINHLGGVQFIFWSLATIIGSSLLVKLVSLGTGLWNIASGAVTLVRGLWMLLPVIGALGAPFLVAVGVVTALAAAGALLYWKWKPITEWFADAIHHITDAFRELYDVGHAVISGLGQFFGGGMMLPSASLAGAGGYGGLNLGGATPMPSLAVPPASGYTKGSTAVTSITAPQTSSTQSDNRQYHIVINAQPGQDPNAIANVLVQRMQGDQAATQKGALYDP